MIEEQEERVIKRLSLQCPMCGGRMLIDHFTYAGERVLVCEGCGAELVLKVVK